MLEKVEVEVEVGSDQNKHRSIKYKNLKPKLSFSGHFRNVGYGTIFL